MEENTQPRKQTKTKQGSGKIDPSFKSKRYRDKLRTEVKALEGLIPVDRPALHRKLDSQTVYRLVIAFLRLKNYFKSIERMETPSEKCVKFGQPQTKSNQTTSASQCHKLEDKIFKDINVNELMEGFIVMLSVDGTIMYVSENVVHFNGFNQVDLIHRCIYGIIHPDDQNDVRNILEENGRYSYAPNVGMGNTKKPKMGISDGGSTTCSFFCRMKCFVGNSAGYTKLHCSGKLHTAHNVPRSSKMSDRFAILFCQQFLYNGNDVMNDSKDNVFWSKHDLDLTFRETEKKIRDILGYGEDELCGVSLYELVHVEDLYTLVTVHKTMTEVSDVQSFFMRLKHKDDHWIWLHSKGKVISKNSKKFSIVFTHCPVRDENSVFLQQEMLLRRKHSLKDLLNLTTFHRYHGDHVTDTADFCITEKNVPHVYTSYNVTVPPKRYKTETLDYLRDCCESPNEEVSVILNPLTFIPVPCPSTWHSNLDRHSPVVPSSHVAHKLCLKEKQLQYAQFKRTQQPLKREIKPGPCVGIAFDGNPETQFTTQNAFNNALPGQRSNMDTTTDLYQQSLYLYNAGPLPSSQRYPVYRMEPQTRAQQFHYLPCFPRETFNYPPSPPPSPRRNVRDTASNGEQYRICHVNNVDQYQIPQPNIPVHVVQQLENHNNTCTPQHCANCQSKGFNPNHYQSHANIKFSMIFDHSPATKDQHSASITNQMLFAAHTDTNSPCNSKPWNERDAEQPANQTKFEGKSNQLRTIGTDPQFVKPSSDCVQYDVEASIHMKIVESEMKTSQTCPEVEIPAFESFMEYLVDDKIY